MLSLTSLGLLPGEAFELLTHPSSDVSLIPFPDTRFQHRCYSATFQLNRSTRPRRAVPVNRSTTSTTSSSASCPVTNSNAASRQSSNLTTSSSATAQASQARTPLRAVSSSNSQFNTASRDDTPIVKNLGYLQFKATPGLYHLEVREGRGREVFARSSRMCLPWSQTITISSMQSSCPTSTLTFAKDATGFVTILQPLWVRFPSPEARVSRLVAPRGSSALAAGGHRPACVRAHQAAQVRVLKRPYGNDAIPNTPGSLHSPLADSTATSSVVASVSRVSPGACRQQAYDLLMKNEDRVQVVMRRQRRTGAGA